MIKNIVFDFGNVLIDLDMLATEKAFVQLFSKKGALMVKGSGILEEFEIGAITEATFLEGLSHYLISDTSTKVDIKKAWNAMLLTIPTDRLELLLDLKSKYRIFLLSNTNETHLSYIYDYLDKDLDITDWDTKYFDKTYYSHKMGLRKPHSEIFRQVLDEQKLKAEETLFVDDNRENIATARRIGLKTILHNHNIIPLKEILDKTISELSTVK